MNRHSAEWFGSLGSKLEACCVDYIGIEDLNSTVYIDMERLAEVYIPGKVGIIVREILLNFCLS